jgi:predicted amino acid racemase
MREYYPRVVADLQKLRENIDQIRSRCAAQGVEIAGVIKGFSGIPACAKVFADAGCQYLGTSRLEQIRDATFYGVKGPFMLLRVPMLGEADEVVRLADLSLNSEFAALRALAAAAKQGKRHSVLLMADLGDLREGFWDRRELLDAALFVEREEHLYLAGVGTNLGCYGSIFPTVEKMNELVACAEGIEARIGRRLDILSGGGSTSLPRVFDGDMPERVNQLRVGEAIINAKDLQDLFGYDMRFMHQDVFVLQAEVVEVKDKPSMPVGEILFDAFGMKQEYIDRGVRRKALLALGKVDYAFPDRIYPRDAGVQILGASSDHTIIDVTDAERDIRVGDIMEFTLCYTSTVFATHSPNVKIVVA